MKVIIIRSLTLVRRFLNINNIIVRRISRLGSAALHKMKNIVSNIYCSKLLLIKKTVHMLKQDYIVAEIHALLLNNRSLDDLILFLKKQKKFFSSWSAINFLTNLYAYTKNSEISIKNFNIENKQTYILHVCSWGASYTDKMIDYLIPSLLSPNNIPSLYKEYNIVLLIHCDKISMSKLVKSNAIVAIKKYATVEYSIIPSALLAKLKSAEKPFISLFFNNFTNVVMCWKYYLLGCLQNIAMVTAKENRALVSFLMPDLLLSGAALTNMLSGIADGKIVAVSTTFRSSFSKIKYEIAKYYSGVVLDISGEKLTKMIVDNMHESAKTRIVSSHNKNFHLTPQLIFSYPDKIVIRSVHYHPMLVNFKLVKNLILSNYYPIDNVFLYNVLDDKIPISDQIWV